MDNNAKPILTKSYIAVAQNASGRNLNVPIYHLSQGLPGPKVYIQSSIHGAEVQGNVVIYHLIKALQATQINGEIILVPNCNPVGTNIKAGEYTMGRFDPINGTNWNRGYYYDHQKVIEFAESVTQSESIDSIKTRFRALLDKAINDRLAEPWGLQLAQQLNLHLQKMASSADIVLDLHNGTVSSRHIYIPEYAKQAAYQFSMPHCIFIPNKFAGALDEACFCSWWTLQEILEQKYQVTYDFNVKAFTLEMGSQEVINFAEGEQDAFGILAYLACNGVLQESEYVPFQMQRIGVDLDNYKTLFTNFGGMVEYCAKPGDHISAGDILARILNIDDLDNDNAVQELKAPCDLISILHFPSASVLSGTQLYKCFTQYYEL